MFDIGFAELVLIFVVGLLVLGPERLPGAVRTVSLWLGRLRRSFTALKNEIEREVGADEIKRQLHNESIMANLKETENSLKESFSSAEEEFRTAQKDLQSLEYDISDVVKPQPTKQTEKPSADKQQNPDLPEQDRKSS
ncbi:sec-independent protein translocase protein TatB [Litorivivens lipolytica]|uniref:Sec-independent protein translocase protein TatB n=1 Tax=Litorivivens lipolytica TaxID=1524264 RepID=A0A7W4W5K6_9GAMM|nr:Sec-independent protein translocase protein TatB [Litorivivens lipolytica]MBB3047760.1 sec-independent protein translocase protein TatB [Litorivivens lipolytica]